MFQSSLLCITTLKGRPFNFLGGGWFKKNCMQLKWNKKFLHCRKKKKCHKSISSFRELYKIPAKLWPFFSCSLLNCGFGDAAKLLFHISYVLQSTYEEVRSFSGSLWLRKSDFPFFLSTFFSVKKQNGWTSVKYMLWQSFDTRMILYSLQ